MVADVVRNEDSMRVTYAVGKHAIRVVDLDGFNLIVADPLL